MLVKTYAKKSTAMDVFIVCVAKTSLISIDLDPAQSTINFSRFLRTQYRYIISTNKALPV